MGDVFIAICMTYYVRMFFLVKSFGWLKIIGSSYLTKILALPRHMH